MKITILQGAFLPVPPALGGAVEKMWFALGKEFVKRGHDVTHISRHYADYPDQEIIDGVVHKRVKGYTTPSSGLYLKWLDLLYTNKAKQHIPADTDVIVTNTFWAPVILNSKLQPRCFVDVQRMPKGQLKWYKSAGRLRANSNVVAEAIKRETHTIAHNRVVMVPNPLPFTVADKTDVGQKTKTLLYAGRIHSEKGLELLIKAFRSVKEPWVLKVVGPYQVAAGGGGEAYFDSLKKLAEGLAVEFTGPVYDSGKLNGYYKEAAVFVYPSIAEQGETFGLAPLEAMAWGCVPIVSNLACFQDFITHEKNGLIFNHRAADAIELLSSSINRLVSDSSYTAGLAKEAARVNQSHSTVVIGDDFLATFQQLLASLKIKSNI